MPCVPAEVSYLAKQQPLCNLLILIRLTVDPDLGPGREIEVKTQIKLMEIVNNCNLLKRIKLKMG